MTLMVIERCGPSRLPLGWLTLAWVTTRRTSASVSRCAASAWGSTWMRTAGRWPPATLTSPTPLIWDSFCATRTSIRSRTRGSGSVGDVTASVITGASAGLILR